MILFTDLGAGVWTRDGNTLHTEWVEEYKQVEFGQIVIMLIQLHCTIWWLQTIWCWKRNSQNDAKSL